MHTRLGAAVLGLLAGLMLTAGGGLSFLAGERSDWYRLLAVAGYAVALGALLLVGYGLAGTAPVWLRLVVSAGLPLLAFSVWQLVADEIDRRADTWRGPASAYLAAGLLMLLLGLLMARRAAPEEGRYQPTHR
ncbi:MAG: hypothetical protein J7518_09620 [Nocardioidaceae bacterium]|nr:hypothetical protein [Nocardioidaceae bacterium]